MAAMVGIGMIAAVLATEPERSREALEETKGEKPATRVIAAAFGAFSEFLTRKDAWAVLAFVILFKFTDAFSGTMTAPFVIDLGYTRNDYAAIVKGVGLAATLIGGFAGGFLARAWSLPACLWFAGIIQALSNLVFAWLATVGINQWALAAAITAENFTGAIGTVIFVAYLSALCNNPLHTATQYALLAALSAVGRTYLSASAGYVAEYTGWPLFFAISVLVAIPSLLLLAWLQRREHFATLAARPRIVRSSRPGLAAQGCAYWTIDPLRDQRIAHLPRRGRARHLIGLDRDGLADERFQPRDIRVAVRDDLKRLRTRLQVAEPIGTRNAPALSADHLVGVDPLALGRLRMTRSSPDSTSPFLIGFGACALASAS